MKKTKLIVNAFIPLVTTTTLILLTGYCLFAPYSTIFWMWTVPSIYLILKCISHFTKETIYILKNDSKPEPEGSTGDAAWTNGLPVFIMFYICVSLVMILIQLSEYIKTLS